MHHWIPTWTLIAALGPTAGEDEWRGFRGTAGGGVATAQDVPTSWSAERNVLWKRALHGRGTSSPIVTGGAVYVTSWSGYGMDADEPGDPAKLRRHLTRIDLDTGEVVWTRDFAPAAEEDPYSGRLTTHGYASSTPTTDGERVYVFFGKAGVFALDLDGERVWHADVGSGSSEWNTGSGSSPLLAGDVLVINAADEGDALIGFDKRTGDELWRREAERLDLAFDTPVLVPHGEEQVIAFALLEEIWAVHPRTGELVWTVETPTNGSLAPGIVADDRRLYSLGGQTGLRSHAVRLGGEGDVTESHVAWAREFGSYVTSPVLVGGHLYWADERGTAHCANAETGELAYRERLDASFYASGVAVGDRIYYLSRDGETFVVRASPEYEELARNVIEGDESSFDASPVVAGGRLLLRSGSHLYCIAGSED